MSVIVIPRGSVYVWAQGTRGAFAESIVFDFDISHAGSGPARYSLVAEAVTDNGHWHVRLHISSCFT